MDKKNEVILRLDNISQSFIVNDNVKIVADNISMDVYDNEFLVVLGPGHCGKTVLMNIIAGLEKPVGGKLSCVCTAGFAGRICCFPLIGKFVYP